MSDNANKDSIPNHWLHPDKNTPLMNLVIFGGYKKMMPERIAM
jgi:hypothetical protein